MSVIIKKIQKKQSAPVVAKKAEKEEGKGSLLDVFIMAFEKLDNNLGEEALQPNCATKMGEENSQTLHNDAIRRSEPRVRKEK